MATYRLPWTPTSPPAVGTTVAPCVSCKESTYLPPTLLAQSSFVSRETTITVEVVRFRTDLYSWTLKSELIRGNVYRLNVFEFRQTQPLDIKVSATDPIMINLPMRRDMQNQAVNPKTGSRTVAGCVMWNADRWVSFDQNARINFCAALKSEVMIWSLVRART